MITSSIEKIFFFALLAIVTIIMVAIFFPFITVLILASSFAVVLHPIYLWLNNKVTYGISWLSSFLTVTIFIIAICVPLFFIGGAVFDQTKTAYNSIVVMSNKNRSFDSLSSSINKALPKGIKVDVGAKVSELVSGVSNNVTGFFASTIKIIAMFMLLILAIFYLLKDGKEWRKSFTLICPLSEETINEIFTKLGISINQIIKGTFLIAIIQGVLAGIGFAVFGVPNAILWGVAAGIASFIPTIGTSIVSIPAILFLFATGMTSYAFGLLIWSVALVGMIDNLLGPFILSKNTQMPSMFILFSILGGVSLMGPVGILIGPLVLSLMYTLISIYRKQAKI